MATKTPGDAPTDEPVLTLPDLISTADSEIEFDPPSLGLTGRPGEFED